MGGARGRCPCGGRAGGAGAGGPCGRRDAHAAGRRGPPTPVRATPERVGRGARGRGVPARVADAPTSVAGLSASARGPPRRGPARDGEDGRRRRAPPRRPRDVAGAGTARGAHTPGLRPRGDRYRGPRAPGPGGHASRRARPGRDDARLRPYHWRGGAIAVRAGDASGRAERRARAAWGDQDEEGGIG